MTKDDKVSIHGISTFLHNSYMYHSLVSSVFHLRRITCKDRQEILKVPILHKKGSGRYHALHNVLNSPLQIPCNHRHVHRHYREVSNIFIILLMDILNIYKIYPCRTVSPTVDVCIRAPAAFFPHPPQPPPQLPHARPVRHRACHQCECEESDERSCQRGLGDGGWDGGRDGGWDLHPL